MSPKRRGYMHMVKYQFLYNRINPAAPEEPEDLDSGPAIWQSLLYLYFAPTYDTSSPFFITFERYDAEAKPYILIRTVRGVWGNSVLEHVVLVEDMRAVVPPERQDAAWAKGVDEMARYIKAIRSGEINKNGAENTRTLYGIVSVGRCSRFYVLPPLALMPEEYPGKGGRPLDSKEDEIEIDGVLREMVKGSSV